MEKKSSWLNNPIARFFDKYTTGAPFVIWGAYGMVLTVFLIIFRNQPFIQFGKLVYILVFATVWLIASDILKKKEVFNKRLHFIIDSLVYLAIFTGIFYFTGGIKGDLFFIYCLVAISAPLFGGVNEMIILLVLAGISSLWVNIILAGKGVLEFDAYHIGLLIVIWTLYFSIAGIIKFFQAGYIKELENTQKYHQILEEQNLELERAKADVDAQVREKTKELKETINFLEQTNKIMIGRELKMIELKEQLEEKSKTLKAENKLN